MTRSYYSDAFAQLLLEIELSLSSYYGFRESGSVVDHLIRADEMDKLDLSLTGELPRGAVIADTSPEASFLGVYFSEAVVASSTSQSVRAITWGELDALAVVVEEVCHFHLIWQRLVVGQRISLIELECQAEIDKVLVLSLYLHRSLLAPLSTYETFALLFERCRPPLGPVYHQAHRLAARFWREAFAHGVGARVRLVDHSFRNFMRGNFQKPLADKRMFPGTRWLTSA